MFGTKLWIVNFQWLIIYSLIFEFSQMEKISSAIFEFVLVIMVNCFALGKFPFKYSKLIRFYRQVSILFSNPFWKFNKKKPLFYYTIRMKICSQYVSPSDITSLTKRQMQWNSTTLNKTTADTIEWKKNPNIIREDVRQFLCIFFVKRQKKKLFVSISCYIRD